VRADPASGTCATETDTISLVYDVADLMPGEYVAHLEVASAEASNSPRVCTVTLTVKSVPGDFNSDLDVDQEDFGHLQECLTGSSGSLSAGCVDADFDHNNRVDAYDLGIFKGCKSGAGTQADPFCWPTIPAAL
jgi:hypothetical protein